MKIMIGGYWTIFNLLLLASTSASDNCNEEAANDCMITLHELLSDEYSSGIASENELDKHCADVIRSSMCVTGLMASCAEKYPIQSGLTVLLTAHLNQMCSPAGNQRQVLLNLLPCFKSHGSTFKQCGTESHQFKDACGEVKRILCVADKSREVCGKDGDTFAKSVENTTKEPHSEVCSGVGCLSSSLGICLLAVLTFFLF